MSMKPNIKQHVLHEYAELQGSSMREDSESEDM
jgi:hypothetical protein